MKSLSTLVLILLPLVYGFKLGSVLLAVEAPAKSIEAMGSLYLSPQEAPSLAKPEFISLPQMRAYPGIEYNIRVCVKGGTWPYRFHLKEAPQGMQIDGAEGIVTWTPSVDAQGSESVTITAIDASGLEAQQRYDIQVAKTGFYFVSPDGDDAHPGTFEQPWRSVMRAAAGEGVTDSAQAILYLREGTYVVDVPEVEGRSAKNVLRFTAEAPRRWLAYPQEKPVIDFAWSEQQWNAKLDKQKARKVKEPSTIKEGHRFALNGGTDGASFDGIEFKNFCYFGFVLRHGQKHLSWRRCRMHSLWADYRENPAFIFTYAVERQFSDVWGKRSKANCYQYMVIQDCHFYDRHYWSPRGTHGGAFVLYTVRDSVIEGNVIEKIERGQCFIDKDNGWANTYRCNRFYGEVMFAAQDCNDEIDFHHNLVRGYFLVGAQPGWVRNIWVHHNTFLGPLNLMGGGTKAAIPLDEPEASFKGPLDADTLRVLAAWPRESKTVHFYNNVVRGPKDGIIMKAVDNHRFADKWRFVRWENNVLQEGVQIQVLWGRKVYPFTDMQDSGIGASDTFVQLNLDEEGRAPTTAAWAKTHGIDASL